MPKDPDRKLLHYRLVEKIGEGGMGVVWKAVVPHVDRGRVLLSGDVGLSHQARFGDLEDRGAAPHLFFRVEPVVV